MYTNHRDQLFISYSHQDREWLEMINTHLAPFVQAGAFSIWNDTMIEAGTEWRQEIEHALDSASVALLLVSPDFLASRFILEDELPPLLDAAEDEGLSILWLPIRPSAYRETEVEAYQALTDPKRPLSSRKNWEVEVELVRVANVIKEEMKSYQSMPTVARGLKKFRKYQQLSKRVPFVNRKKELKALKDALDRLIKKEGTDGTEKKPENTETEGSVGTEKKPENTETEESVGTEKEPESTKRVFVLYGDGGIGKTSVVEHWLEGLPAARLKDVQVVKWSFYGQDYFDSQERSSDLFFENALRSLGEAPLDTPFDNCEKLLEIATTRKLLISLDGLEVLQYTSGSHENQIRDLALLRLLQTFSRLDLGMCVVTTRCPLKGSISQYVHQASVDRLRPEHGAELLRRLDVRGSKKERRRVSQAVCGHPLSLTLIAAYLHRECDGNVRGWQKVLSKSARVSADALAEILKKYEKRLLSPEELSLLRLLAILDRAISTEQVYALAEEIVNLSQPLAAKALRRLARSGIIHYSSERSYVDAHPAVRKYFAGRMRVKSVADDWEQIHARLYAFFVNEVEKLQTVRRPLIDNAALLDAIRHGCTAGLLREAFDLYWVQLVDGRKRSSFHDRPYGAESFPILIDCLSGFFARRWSDVRRAADGQKLTDDQKCRLFEEAGHYLFVDGRLDDAKDVLAKAIYLREQRIDRLGYDKMSDKISDSALKNDFYGASRHRRLRAEACLARGELREAISNIGKSIQWSERLKKPRDQIGPIAASAYIRYHLGRIDEAKDGFSKAEKIRYEVWKGLGHKKQKSTRAPVLASYWGLWCGEFYLHCADVKRACGHHSETEELLTEVFRRSGWMLWEAENADWVLDRGHAFLLLGQARGARMQPDLPANDERQIDQNSVGAHGASIKPELFAANEDLDQALSFLRSAGEQHHLVRGLLARSRMLCAAKQAVRDDSLAETVDKEIEKYLQKAISELEEATDLAEQHGMKLLIVDSQIEEIKRRRYISSEAPDSLEPDFLEVAKKVKKMEYGRYFGTLYRWSVELPLEEQLKGEIGEVDRGIWEEAAEREEQLKVSLHDNASRFQHEER